MHLAPDGPMAIPLWVNGHAFLTVVESFFSVVDARTGEAVRRVPLCGVAEADEAAAAAKAAQPAWSALSPAERLGYLSELATALDNYTGHFAKLVGQETGLPEPEAIAEVATAVAALRNPGSDEVPGVVAIITDASRPLSALAGLGAAILAAGGTVICKPSPKAPSAAFALCELSARVGWPAGILNLIHGDEAAVEGLCAAGTVERVAYAGAAALGEKIAQVAARHGKPFAAKGS